MKKSIYDGLVGKKINDFLVLELLNERRNGKMAKFLLCECKCGKKFKRGAQGIKLGRTKNCGCEDIKIKHGKTNTRLYNIWCGIKNRCNNPKVKIYPYYGGKGVKICEEWEKDFEKFYNWAMENGYNDKLTIDRIDSNGDYEPNNCRCATMLEQAKNKDWETIGKKGRKWVLQLDPNTKEVIAEHFGVTHTEKKLGVKNICTAIKKGTKAGGYYWKHKQ